MRCAHCDWKNELDDTPEYCLECGNEWRDKTVEDVDWPVEIEIAARPNIMRYVEEQTGVRLFRAPTDYEVLIDALVYEDRTVEVISNDG